MGVRGLQTFLKINPSLATQEQLSDTTLIIDANNLFCKLFCELCLRSDSTQWRADIYGGDMVTFSNIIMEFFSSLDKCNVTPILVFDGSSIGKQSTKDHLALKEQAIYRRGVKHFQVAKDMVENWPIEGETILPQVILHVFKNVLSDLGIQRIQSPYEADTHIARIANDLKCPVLTNDSDFIIYPLPKGFVMIDFLPYKNLSKTKDGKFFIECPVFSQARLMRQLPGLRLENMPLLSVLLGNDYVEAGTFDRVVNSICNGSNQSALNAETRTQTRIANLLSWLRHKSQEEAIEYVLDGVHHNGRERLRTVIKILLRNYKIEATDNFEAELNEIFPPSQDVSNIPEFTPAAYLRRLMETSDLGPIALDIIFHNTYYNYAIIDDFNLPSSSYVKYRPFSLAVTLLRPSSYLNLTTYSRQVKAEKDALIIFDRVRDQYTKISIRPVDSMDDFGSVENLNIYSTIALEPALKKSLLMTTFRFNAEELNLISDTLSQIFTKEFVQESSLCMLLVKYIGLETKINPKPQFVEALIMTLVYYAALGGKLNKNAIQDSQCGKFLLKLRPYSIKLCDRSHNEPSSPLYRRIVHFISQLQSAYIAFCLVNSLLNHVFQVPRYEKFFNGTLIYRLTKLLRQGDLQMSLLCHEMPLVIDACNTIKVIVHCQE